MADNDWFHSDRHVGSFQVAGWSDFGDDTWLNVEAGDLPLEVMHPDDLSAVEMVTVHYLNDAGDEIYFTLHGPFEDWDQLADFIDDALDGYGIET